MDEDADDKSMSRKTLAMKQYDDVKKNYQDAIVFFQLGDFYETFYEDAKIASKVLEITLTSRGMGSNGERIPLAGVPIKAIDGYLKILVEKGYKVAIVDQLEDARKAQGKIVKRGVTRVITPGTVYESSILDKNTNNFLSSLVINEKNSILGFSLVDISTGEFLVTEFKDNVIEQFQDEFTRFAPREIILPDVLKKGTLQTEIENLVELSSQAVIYSQSETIFNYDTAKQTLMKHFEVKSLAGFGCESMVEGIRAAGAIISYISTLKEELPDNILSLRTLDNREFLVLDSNSQRNLEIIANAFDGKMTGSLLSIYSDISTNMGARLIRRWLLQPLRDKNAINSRLDVVEELSHNLTTLEEIRSMLMDISDFQRLIAKIQYNAVNARDLIALKTSLKIGTKINSFLEKCNLKNYICRKIMNFDVTDLLNVIDLIEIGIVDSPPPTIKEGGIIKPSYHPDLNQYYELKNNQSTILNEIEKREQERTSFNIKLGYNSVHGYYLEVTKAQLRDAGEDSIPPEYIRRQTLVNAERFITPELKDIEEKILNAEEKTQELEYHLFCEIREKIALKVPTIKEFSELIAELDVLVSYSFTALKNNFCKPEFIDEPIIDISEGRHPVVEYLQKDTGFVPNSSFIGKGELHIITGPNMSGKSTFIRQVALIVLMAQAGSWVPAKKCILGIVDKIFTRVGAFDRLAFGQSTFMLEMLETAHILNNSTYNSLIILDEVGRGTSTFDGLSLAWAIAEHIGKVIKSKTLFATHYHQLSELQKYSTRVKNFHQTAKERNGKLILLYKIEEGSTDSSFGISVAKMAGIPKQVIHQAQKKLLELESSALETGILPEKSTTRGQIKQLSLVEAFSKNVVQQQTEQQLKDLRLEILAFLKNYLDIDVNHKTPIEALQQLGQLIEEIKSFEQKIREKYVDG